VGISTLPQIFPKKSKGGRRMKSIKEMIEYFEGVKSQHQIPGFRNPHSEAIVNTYEFVIEKLKEWQAKEPEE